MGGEECLINIKKNTALKKIPVIVYSTTRHEIEIQTFKRLGAAQFIVKPPTCKELVDVLKQVLI
jgi:CheY-like chemotaxis protein